MSQEVSEGRKAAHYGGIVLVVIGGVLFASTFVSGCLHFGDFTNFEGRARTEIGTALVGMAFLFVGGFLQTLGSRGLAGSGVILDPGKAREDLKPYSQMAGGMLRDALDEAKVQLPPAAPAVEVVRVRCRSCNSLNEEDARFCKGCGQAL